MQYYLVTLKSLPGLGFAHNVKPESNGAPKTSARKNRQTKAAKLNIPDTISADSPMLEIIVYRGEGVSLVGNNGNKLDCGAGTVSVAPHMCRVKEPDAGVFRFEGEAEYLSVGITGDFTVERVEAGEKPSPADLKADGTQESETETAAEEHGGGLTLMLPAMIRPDDTKLAGDVYEEILRRLILTFINSGSVCDAACEAIIFELLSKLDAQCRALESAESGRASKTDMFYSRLILRYISDHIAEKIRIGDISSHLNISVAYLSKQFREATGMTVVDCVNRLKVARIRELIVTRGITLREAGEQVGITDVNYLSRLFKRYSGMSVGELKRTELRNAGYTEDTVDIRRLRGR